MGCTWLIVLGGVLEAVGFGCIVGELARIQWRELGTPKSLLWVQARWGSLRARWRRLIRKLRGRPPVEHQGRVSMGAAATVSTEGYGWHGMGPNVPDRLGAVERNLTALHEQHNKTTAKLRERIRTLDQDLRSTRSAIDRRDQEREADRQSSLRSSIRLQVAATFFFLVGLGLSVWGSVATC